MSKAPPIPKEQRSFDQRMDPKSAKGDPRGRRDAVTDLQSSQPGDADVNLSEQGRHGNIKQNLTHQGRQQDR
jgi:hypothetical protein